MGEAASREKVTTGLNTAICEGDFNKFEHIVGAHVTDIIWSLTNLLAQCACYKRVQFLSSLVLTPLLAAVQAKDSLRVALLLKRGVSALAPVNNVTVGTSRSVLSQKLSHQTATLTPLDYAFHDEANLPSLEFLCLLLR